MRDAYHRTRLFVIRHALFIAAPFLLRLMGGMATESHTDDTDDETVDLLEKIERNTSFSWWTVIGEGLLRGAAFTIGSVFIIAIASWLLSLLGIIPGIGDIAQYLNELLRSRTGM